MTSPGRDGGTLGAGRGGGGGDGRVGGFGEGLSGVGFLVTVVTPLEYRMCYLVVLIVLSAHIVS